MTMIKAKAKHENSNRSIKFLYSKTNWNEVTIKPTDKITIIVALSKPCYWEVCMVYLNIREYLTCKGD